MKKSLTLAGLPRAGTNSKPHHYKWKVQKMKYLLKTLVLTEKQFEDFLWKKNGNILLDVSKNPMEHKDRKSIIWKWPVYTVRIKLYKTWKKAFRVKLLELCKSRARKSRPDTFNFYVVLVGQETLTDAGRATTCGRKFKASSLQTKY